MKDSSVFQLFPAFDEFFSKHYAEAYGRRFQMFWRGFYDNPALERLGISTQTDKTLSLRAIVGGLFWAQAMFAVMPDLVHSILLAEWDAFF
ncbi:MAG: hypothetical protein Q8N04_13395 [Nitrospira sp.]|nr:hypothetical protein [Nitrospira sp.]